MKTESGISFSLSSRTSRIQHTYLLFAGAMGWLESQRLLHPCYTRQLHINMFAFLWGGERDLTYSNLTTDNTLKTVGGFDGKANIEHGLGRVTLYPCSGPTRKLRALVARLNVFSPSGSSPSASKIAQSLWVVTTVPEATPRNPSRPTH